MLQRREDDPKIRKKNPKLSQLGASDPSVHGKFLGLDEYCALAAIAAISQSALAWVMIFYSPQIFCRQRFVP
jgi:hypothetical protein